MNFLPFVFTFLLLLTLTSSFMFSSIIKTAQESHLILSQHKVYLELLSEQNKEFYDDQVPKPQGNSGEPPKPPPSTKQPKSLKEEDKEPRLVRDGCEERKLNLFSLREARDQETQHALQQIAIRLIEILYGSCEFYRSSQLKDIAHTIVQQITSQKIHSLEELQFEDQAFTQIYYKMLQGTNTGYPPLTEYIRLKPQSQPIHFAYAPAPVMRAALGEQLAATLFDLEREQRKKNKHIQVLPKKEFLDLAANNRSSLIPQSVIKNIFAFTKIKKGTPQIRQQGKIRAIHKNLSQ